MTSYADRLKHPRWQRRRLEILNRSNFTCEECGSKEKTLHVHHKLYRKGAMPWEYVDRELQVLCEECHERVTHVHALLSAAMAEMDHHRLQDLLGFAEGLVAKDRVFTDEELQDRQRKWPLRSYGHAWGFLVCNGAGVPQPVVESWLERQPLNFDDVESIGFQGVVE